MSEKLTDSEIVAGLRSDEPTERTAALDALFEGDGGGLLVRLRATSADTATTSTVNVSTMFQALLWMAQEFGKHLGFRLGWVPSNEDNGKLVVPRGRMLQ